MSLPKGIKVKKGRMSSKPPMSKWIKILDDNLGYKSNPSRNKIFGSNAGLCSRQTAGMILMDESFESVVDASSEFYFAIGSSFEKVIKKAFKKSGLQFIDEIHVSGQMAEDLPEISGRVDFTVKEDGELTLIELKSCGKLPDKPRPSHLAQLKTYLLLTGVQKGVLWYVSRNVANYKGEIQSVTFEVEPTDSEFLKTATEIAIGSLGAVNELIPQIPPHMKKYKCGFCPLIKMCWDGGPSILNGEQVLDLTQSDLEMGAHKLANEFMETRGDLLQLFDEEFESMTTPKVTKPKPSKPTKPKKSPKSLKLW